MLASIISYGLALGAVYALIGITYNVMFSASRVFSFTAGAAGMLGGVLGALFIDRMGMPVLAGFLLTLAAGAVLGILFETVISALTIFYTMLSAALLLPLLAGLYTKRVNARAAR